MKLQRDSERVSPTGNIAPAGILNQLGRPTMDPLAVLIREAVQNSWDARLSDTASVLFHLDGWVLSSAQRHTLSDEIFADWPPDSSLPLYSCLSTAHDIAVLAVSDRGTTGLGGPTRADVVTQPSEPRDFVEFLRDVGQPQQKRFAGGTYGYGKAAFYRVSSVNTILVYTRCMTASGFESRFTATGLGEAFTLHDIRYTGRHWWGQHRNDVVEPILNEEADRIAATVGLPAFADDELGTTIAVIQPHFFHPTASDEMQPPEQVCRRMVEYLLLYFWPKMLRTESGEPAMRFGITWQGTSLPIADPASYPPLQGFVQAMQRLKAPALPNSPLRHIVKDIASQRPAKHLGRLALQQVLVSSISDPIEEDESSSSLLTQLTHHTALMRQPELIVKYAPGPILASPYVGYAGVFIVDADVDEIFAACEPPTHDAWVRDALESRSERIYVNVALRSVDQEMAAFAHPPPAASAVTPLTPLGAFASMIGDSLAPAVLGPTARPGVSNGQQQSGTTAGAGSGGSSQPKGSSAGMNAGKGQTSARPGRAHVRALSEGDFVLADGTPALRIPFSVFHAPESKGTIVQAVISAVLDGSQLETEPPIGGSRAAVLCWTAPDCRMYQGQAICIPIQMQGTWHVSISTPSDIVLSVELRATAHTQ